MVGLAALGGFGLTFADFLKYKDVYLARFDLAKFEKGLRSEAPLRDRGHLGDWQRDYSPIHTLNVTGEVKVDTTSSDYQAPPPPPLVSADDLEVTYIQFVAEAAPQNCAFIGPRNVVLQPDQKIAADLYCSGDTFELDSKPGVEIRVVAIHQDSVDLEVPGRDIAFTLRPGVYEVDDKRILAGANTVPSSVFRPANTRRSPVDPNGWEVGTADMDEIAAMNEDELLASFVVRPKRDPKTGNVRGLQINSIKKDSVMARQGFLEQDIILDVDGFPATDRARMIEYLRNNPSRTTVSVRFERAGSIRTYTYSVPGR